MYHPDRVKDSEKAMATVKFNVLHQAYSILSNSITRSQYDAGDTQVLTKNKTNEWEHYIKIVNNSDFACARQTYQGSFKEESDIVREFVIGKGSITHLFNTIPFMRYEDEPRIIEIIRHCIELGKIPKMNIRKMRH